MQTETRVTTTSGEVYLKKLCRHFAHKVPATLIGDQGIIDFPFGRCRMLATSDHMRLSIEVTNAQEVASAERVVTDHLVRMARGSNLDVQWVRTGARR